MSEARASRRRRHRGWPPPIRPSAAMLLVYLGRSTAARFSLFLSSRSLLFRSRSPPSSATSSTSSSSSYSHFFTAPFLLSLTPFYLCFMVPCVPLVRDRVTLPAAEVRRSSFRLVTFFVVPGRGSHPYYTCDR